MGGSWLPSDIVPGPLLLVRRPRPHRPITEGRGSRGWVHSGQGEYVRLISGFFSALSFTTHKSIAALSFPNEAPVAVDSDAGSAEGRILPVRPLSHSSKPVLPFKECGLGGPFSQTGGFPASEEFCWFIPLARTIISWNKQSNPPKNHRANTIILR